MLSYLKGNLIDLESNSVIVLTASGIGYELIINELTYARLLNEKETEIYVYHHITENSQSLFGFLEKEEKELFKELIKVSGIGGKVANNILSLGIDKLIQAVKMEDEVTITSIPGIGKKMASKMILELKDKDIFKHANLEIKKEGKTTRKIESSLGSTVIESLTNMGYKKQDIERVLQVLPENMTSVSEIIPFVIKNIG
ncbi:MAG: Holliday junction branch migration protein RuvA [Candidatus Gracilibacteria bacterium]|nr:Holliday junction branch migration protein RuvA [Candidatus Gracilibacteria bacterium]